MFDLAHSIAEWRRQMLAAGIKTPVPLEELESHLREEIEQQIKAGSSGQQAFEAAVSRIGRGAELKTEFTKQKSVREILQTEIVSKKFGLMLERYSYPVVCFLFLFIGGMLFLKAGNFSTMTPVERTSGLAACVLSCLFCCSGSLGRGIFPIIPNKATRTAICGFVGLFLLIGTMVFFANVNCNMGQLIVELLWVFVVPVGALLGLISGLENAARQKSAAANS